MSNTYDITGFIFDLDGVLTDTSEFHYLAWQRFCDEESIAFDRQRNEGMRGVHRADAMRGLLAGRTVTEADFSEMMDRKNRYYLAYLDRVTPANLLPGARDLLEEMRSAGLSIAVGSASRNAPAVIDRLGIAPLLDAVSDGNSVSRSKPAPDLFLHAADRLKRPPAECVVVEDAEAGVAAAHAAGMRAVGIGPRKRVGQAEFVMDSLANARLSAIIKALLPCRPPDPERD